MSDLFEDSPSSLRQAKAVEVSIETVGYAQKSADARYQRMFGDAQDEAARDEDHSATQGASADTSADCNPQHIQRSIAEALGRRAERHIHHETDGILVEVTDGRVSLSGEVATWHEKEAIIGVVRHSPGVHAIEDHLLITEAH